jgi:hypothetical protein
VPSSAQYKWSWVAPTVVIADHGETVPVDDEGQPLMA